ncbi:MAG: hypothetical protein ACT4QD_10185 [Acidobacteriota bacterium]
MTLPILAALGVLASLVLWPQQLSTAAALQTTEREPSASLIPAPLLVFPGEADSNSPAVWALDGGELGLFVFTSIDGHTRRHAGLSMEELTDLGEIELLQHPGWGVWLEAIVPDVDGTWYGYYHNEWPAGAWCPEDTRAIPRIGAARSQDFGRTWVDLGVVLEAPVDSHDCSSKNVYFAGGVGDFSVLLDHDKQDVYFYFSQYGRPERAQGVSAARLAWADRDRPTGRIAVWQGGQVWLPPRRERDGDVEAFAYAPGFPMLPVAVGWHESDVVDAFWGPSIHWNSYLERYVMLLNRAEDSAWTQSGIYVSFGRELDAPESWSTPKRLLDGGDWYPQVLGLEPGVGTDRTAGETARFFIGGKSRYLIQFAR